MNDIIIVLSHPSEPGNVGAVCRAMKNMGHSRLRIVASEEEKKLLDPQIICSRAIHAVDVFENAGYFEDLSRAVADCSIVIGTTRRRGKKRKDFSFAPKELATDLKERPGQAAIVFGNERTGLEADELSLCNMASSIPVNGEFPSLNLSHAVQLYAYEFFLAMGTDSDQSYLSRRVPVSSLDISRLVTVVTDSLQSVGFYKQAGRSEQEMFFRDVFARAGISLKESRYLEAIFRKMARLASGTDTEKVENIGNREHT